MNRRAGLGRGLGALLPGANEARIVELALDEIRPNPYQPRTEFGDDELRELADSITRVGILQPVVVRPVGEAYELLVGERRLRAARIAGLQRIPALVRDAEDAAALEQALVENLQRQDLRPLEEAHAYRALMDVFDLTHEHVAQRIGKSRVHVTNTLRLLDLPDGARALLEAGLLSAGHARAVLSLRDVALQEATARRVVDEGLSVRQVEAMARQRAADPAAHKEPRGRARSYTDLEEALSDKLSTDVRVESGRRRGRITITFGSEQDLGRIVGLLLDDHSS